MFVCNVRASIKKQPGGFGSVGEVPGALLLPLALEGGEERGR